MNNVLSYSLDPVLSFYLSWSFSLSERSDRMIEPKNRFGCSLFPGLVRNRPDNQKGPIISLATGPISSTSLPKTTAESPGYHTAPCGRLPQPIRRLLVCKEFILKPIVWSWSDCGSWRRGSDRSSCHCCKRWRKLVALFRIFLFLMLVEIVIR